MNKLSVPILLFAVIGITWFLVGNSEENANFTEFSYVTKDATKGDISNTISATGTLAAVDDVIIGAQLSGKITDVFVDFNDKVDAGQLLAQIDSRSFQARVDQAAAQVDKTKAEIKIQKIAIARSQLTAQRAERDYQRGLTVSKEKFISENELDQLKTAAATSTLDYENQQAQLESLQATLAANKASLKQSEIDLNHTQIISPIDGFIINRTIEPGQTVASSLNTPELFTVAKNLSEMEIEAYIDESDIGPVEEGQTVSFSVDAFPERKLRGRVKQIRQAPQTNSGVISYTVIIATHNPANMLLPGMTANLEINIDAVRDVQRIDNAALRVASKLSSSSSKESEKPKRRGMMAQMEALNLTDEQKPKFAKQCLNAARIPQEGFVVVTATIRCVRKFSR